MKRSANILFFTYHSILLYLGLIAVFKLEIDVQSVKWLPFLGWMTLLLYQFVKLGLLSSQQEKSIVILSHLAPLLILIVNHYFLADEILFLFLDLAVLEILSLMISLSILFILYSDHHGVRLWQQRGIIPILVIAFILFGSWGFVETWLQRNHYLKGEINYWALATLGIAFLFAVRNHLYILNQILKRKLNIPNLFISKKKNPLIIILLEILIWMIVIPLLF